MTTAPVRPPTGHPGDPRRVNADDPAVRQGATTTLQSVRRAAKLLIAVAAKGTITAREAATEFSLSLPTAYHLLNSLASEGLLAKEGTRGYVLGPFVAVIADAVGREMRVPERYQAALRDLVDATGETAYLSSWRSGQLRILSVAEGNHMVRVTGLTVGYSEHLHARTSARVLLAFADPDFRAEQIERLRLRPLTPTTITSREALTRDLDEIRTAGISVGRDEYVAGLTSASVPIFERGQVVAAVTLAAPSERYRETEMILVSALRSAGTNASHTSVEPCG